MSDRSASPAREPRPKKQKTGGFKWKESKPRDAQATDSRDSGRLERGYRDHSPRRDSYRDRDDDRSTRTGDRDNDRSKRDADPPTSIREVDLSNDKPTKPKDPEKPKKDKKEKKSKAPVSNEPMIVVNINDRLGTKAAIPCLASDSVKSFRALVAMQIGRQPHEIMLKRQGERPFKDQLTLEDYGVSNGVQLDLELDTGD